MLQLQFVCVLALWVLLAISDLALACECRLGNFRHEHIVWLDSAENVWARGLWIFG